MSSIYLSPSLNFTSKRVVTIMAAYWPISALSVSEKLVYRFRFFALYCLACFSNTRFTLPFASRVASAPILVSLRLGNGGSRAEILAYTGTRLEKKKKKKKLLKNNGTYSATFNVVILHKAGNIHYRCFSWNS